MALYKGFQELVDAGLAGTIPKLIGLGHCGSPKYAQVLKKRVERCREPVLTGLSYSQPYVRETVSMILKALLKG